MHLIINSMDFIMLHFFFFFLKEFQHMASTFDYAFI